MSQRRPAQILATVHLKAGDFTVEFKHDTTNVSVTDADNVPSLGRFLVIVDAGSDVSSEKGFSSATLGVVVVAASASGPSGTGDAAGASGGTPLLGAPAAADPRAYLVCESTG